ncbi:hypothetical protein GT031_30500 [Streptomyces sp. SID2888]|nr:hypothetical protein [Streptomyces sp. SID2888]MYV49760.1 hypothetical protein [Streptomyces sp. SID2888]
MLASAAGVALLAGCSSAPDPAARNSALSSADRARARAARDSAALAERYAEVIAAHPGLAERLRPLRAEVLRHVQAFGGASGSASGSASASASASSPASASASVTPSASGAVPSSASGPASASGSASASAGASSVPEDPKAALKGLATAERNLADRRAEALQDLPGESARLMASVAAAGAVHAYLLTEGGK